LPPLPGMGELVLNTLFLSIATILTLYLFLFRSWVRDTVERGQSRSSVRSRSNYPQWQSQQKMPFPL
jgi:hypothetical protein